MAWESLVDWANGQIISAMRMNAIHANVEFLRDEMQYRPVMLHGDVARREIGMGTPTYTRVQANGSNIATSTGLSSSWTLRTLRNMDISSFSAGVHELRLQGGASLLGTVITTHFVKSADMNYITALFENRSVVESGVGYIEFRLVRMFAHRESWPW